MPFSKSDALKHKKGLSDSEQSKWASIANSVRKVVGNRSVMARQLG